MSARPVTVSVLLLVLPGWWGLAAAVGAQTLPLNVVLTEASRCLRGGPQRTCEASLDWAEQLQRLATEQEAYPCQTLLLTLQADIILQQLGHGRADRAFADLEGVRRGCAGLSLRN